MWSASNLAFCSTTCEKKSKKSLLESTVERLLIRNVDAMQSAVGTKTFAEHYKEFIAAAADHMELVAPFLPALTQLLL